MGAIIIKFRHLGELALGICAPLMDSQITVTSRVGYFSK